MLDLDLTRIFVKVVQHNSFTKAAKILEMPKSTVSKAISRLENETATKLLVRSTRSLTLTPAGRSFYEASLGPVTLLEDAQKSLYGQDKALRGLIKLTAPEDLGSILVVPAIARLSIDHPDLKFSLHYTDALVDLIRDGFDLAVRIGPTRDSTLKLKRAGEVAIVPVASPQYLSRSPKIRSPADLKEHPALCLNVQSIMDNWTLRSAKGTVHVPVVPKIICNQMTSLLQMAVAGAGIALAPKYLCQSLLEQKKLTRILPEWSSPGRPVSLISPLAPSSSARLKITVDHILASLNKGLL